MNKDGENVDKTKILCISKLIWTGYYPKFCSFLSNTELLSSVYNRHPPKAAHCHGKEKKRREVEFWLNFAMSSPSKQSNSTPMFSKCGLLPLFTACQGCCGGRKDGEGFPLCVSARRRESRRDLLHMDVSWHVFFIMHSASQGVRAFVFVCVCLCVFVFVVGGGGCVTERI